MQGTLSTISARFVRPYLALAEEHLSGLGLEQIDFDDPEARIDYALALRVFEIGREVTGRDDLGIVGALKNGSSLRILEYLSRASRTPLDALEKVARYQNLIHDACLFTLERRATRITAAMGSRQGVAFHDVVADFFMASLVMGLYRLGVSAEGATVELVRAAPRDTSQFAAAFRCSIRFGAQMNAASFPVKGLSRPLVDADPALCAMLELHADRMLARLPQGQPLLDDLRRWIAQHLADGELSLPTAAKSLGLSERTLRRRLQDRGTSFQTLLDEARAQAASEYLTSTDLAVEEIAFLLGFSEASAFRRAYVRWHGRAIPKRRTLAARSA